MFHRGTLGAVFRLVLLAAAAGASCKSSSSTVGIDEGCSINSDCASQLVCAFGRCHAQCVASKDCALGERCVVSNGPGVCQLAQETSCVGGSLCPSGEVCGADQQCRVQCTTSGGCVEGDYCLTSGASGACYSASTSADESALMAAGILSADGAVIDASSPAIGPDSSAGSNGPDGSNGADVATGADGGSGDDGGGGSTGGGDAGCSPMTGDAAVFGYVPSNFDPGNLAAVDGSAPDGGVNWTDPPDASCANSHILSDCLGGSTATVVMSDGSLATLYVVNNFVVQNAAVLGAENYYNAYPIIIAALGTVEIQGTLNVGVGAGLGGTYPGPGGFPLFGNASLGPGGGASGGAGSAYPTSGSGGGAYCGAGGAGGGTAPLAPGGAPYGTPEIIPLAGGSAGGGGDSQSGGAVQISSAKSILVRNTGVITAYGLGYSAGGGAGGAILLEAPTINVQGTLAVNGAPGGGQGAIYGGSGISPVANPPGGNGSGGATVNGGPGSLSDAGPGPGSGGGGAGYIRLNAACPPIVGASAIISPSLAPITACASVGTLKGP